MKYYVYVFREFSYNELVEFDSKELALEFIGSNWSNEDGYLQLIEGIERYS